MLSDGATLILSQWARVPFTLTIFTILPLSSSLINFSRGALVLPPVIFILNILTPRMLFNDTLLPAQRMKLFDMPALSQLVPEIRLTSMYL